MEVDCEPSFEVELDMKEPEEEEITEVAETSITEAVVEIQVQQR